MPGVYKEKSCKFCQTLHRKRGLYCSQSCANRDRPEYSANVAIAMRKVAEEYYNETFNQDKELPKDVKDMLDNL